MTNRPALYYEHQYWRAGKNLIAGVDEVGRGPLAGPVLAGAVIFEKNYFLPGVRDSKKLSPQKRMEFAAIIKREAICWATGLAGVDEIERYNIRQATFLAMRRALAALTSRPDFILVDGENLSEIPYDSVGIIGGDNKSFTIAAASIVAKVERDRIMTELDQGYPLYRFARNKGYGTKEHIQILRRYGPSDQHRRSFLNKIIIPVSTGEISDRKI
jgi:ribonuclease HII